MKLGDLLASSERWRINGDPGLEITGLAYDSKRVKPGDLFFALARDEALRNSYVGEALSRGARAVVVKGGDGGIARPATVIVECERPRFLMAVAASRLYDMPSSRLQLVGITGTSGKTTTAYLLKSIFEASGGPAGMVGTIGIFIGERKIYSGLTTPESTDFEAALAEMERAGVRRVAAEISSIGLDEGRVERLCFSAALFTNLGHDHLDYHGTVEDYFAAKMRLFSELLPKNGHSPGVAVARGDDPFGRRVLEAVRYSKVSFGLCPGCDVRPLNSHVGLDGIRATVALPGGTLEVSSPLLGELNLLNILAALATAAALGIEANAMAEGIQRCPGAPGRLDVVPGPPGVTVLVDYAHKPDALNAMLEALRALGPRRLLCVFGCGGDRDRAKRPLMGEIAGRLADLPILTSDNPRTEDPLKIIAEVEAGLIRGGRRRIDGEVEPGRYLVEANRRAAIEFALRQAGPGDMVVIAGKGHEDYQIIGDHKIDFDDRKVVREVMRTLRSGG